MVYVNAVKMSHNMGKCLFISYYDNQDKYLWCSD